MGALQADTADALPHIEEVLQREVVFRLLKPSELTHLHQPFVHLADVCREGHLVGLLLSETAQAVRLQQLPDFIETYLMFKISWVNHGAKVQISEQNPK